MIQPTVQQDYLTTYNNASERRKTYMRGRGGEGGSDNVPQSVKRVVVKKERPRASQPKKTKTQPITLGETCVLCAETLAPTPVFMPAESTDSEQIRRYCARPDV